jgi:hypothetical protein
MQKEEWPPFRLRICNYVSLQPSILFVRHQQAKSWIITLHCKENAIYVFLFWELRGLSDNFYIHVSVSNLRTYTPRICPHISLQQNRQTDPGNICINLSQIHECRNWDTEHYNSILFQTFIRDFQKPFICRSETIKTQI